jgi:ribonuclease BN (tRNA processing enzyme)
MRLAQVMEALFENSSRTPQKFDLAVAALTSGKTKTFGAVTVTPFAVVHGESGGPFLGYRIEAEGRVIAYSADTEWTDSLIPLAREADLFIAETYYYDRIVKNHLSLKTLEAHLSDINAKRLILTHLSDDMLARVPALAYATAHDGMTVNL